MIELATNPIVIGFLVFLAFIFIFPIVFQDRATQRKQKVLEQITQQHGAGGAADGNATILRGHRMSDSDTMERLLGIIPGVEKLHRLLLKAGAGMSLTMYLMMMLLFIAAMTALFFKLMGYFGFVVGPVIGVVLPIKLLQRKVRKRNELFINMFPDAIDMIVRSVRSGHPLNASLRMISDNMDPPVSTEFKQVVDEISYGRTLPEAMTRMSQRIGETDLKFFVVVLSVQQETGGNLAEVLSNLSSIIRKRKQLRLKIKALTSEGRMTMWILGSLPFFEFGILWIMNREYLDPLFTTTAGQVILWSAIGMVGLCFWVISRMINIDI